MNILSPIAYACQNSKGLKDVGVLQVRLEVFLQDYNVPLRQVGISKAHMIK